ncbi:MAG: urease accessory protein [Acidobacteria bacterium]|nr:urease accessory protein [Acidobacteriota bacterium]
MSVIDLIATAGLGSLLGLRHALEPDHVAAVSTLMTSERSSGRAALLGVFWGLGHTAALVAVGLALVVFRAELPPALADLFELLVAFMLVGLGARAVCTAARQGPDGPIHVHRHGGMMHRHAAAPAHVHVWRWTLARRPLLVGAVHGLAGSGALTALVLTTLPSAASRLIYMALFGLGSTAGMAALSGLLGWPLARAGAHRSASRAITFTIGAMSIGLGMVWGYPLAARLLAG